MSLSAGRGVVSATDAAKNFGRVVDEVRESRAEIVVERGGVPVARIVPADDRPFTGRRLRALLRAAGAPDPAFARLVHRARARANRPAVPRNPWAS
jgi:prevent-host-death family protein